MEPVQKAQAPLYWLLYIVFNFLNTFITRNQIGNTLCKY